MTDIYKYPGKLEIEHFDYNELPYVPCQIKIYKSSDIVQCLKIRKENLGEPLKLALIGDSQLRFILGQIFINLNNTLNFEYKSESGIIYKIPDLKQFATYNFRDGITFSNDYLTIAYHFTSFPSMRQDLARKLVHGGSNCLKIMKTLAEAGTNNISRPDFLLFNDAAWSLETLSQMESLDRVVQDFDVLAKYLKEISKTTVVLIKPDIPKKDFLGKYRPNGAYELISELQYIYTNKTGATIWDTTAPIFLKELYQCKSFYKSYGSKENELPVPWRCFDKVHPSVQSNKPSVNMIWNLACNKVLQVNENYCCSR